MIIEEADLVMQRNSDISQSLKVGRPVMKNERTSLRSGIYLSSVGAKMTSTACLSRIAGGCVRARVHLDYLREVGRIHLPHLPRIKRWPR